MSRADGKDTGLAAHERDHVLWIGGPIPSHVMGVFFTRDLKLIAVEPNSVSKEAPRARALIIEYGPHVQDVAPLEPIIDVAIAHGLAIAIVKHDTVGFGPYEEATTPVVTQRSQIKLFHGNVEATAQFSAAHSPGHGANDDVEFSGDVPDDPEALLLFRRAFFDHNGLRLGLIASGLSGAHVWVAFPSSEDESWRTQPWLIKIHDKASIAREKGNMRSAVENCTPAGMAPRACDERCVVGNRQALLVQDFIRNATSFRETWKNHIPDALVGALFGGALRDWYRNPSAVAVPLGSEFERLKALRWTSPTLESTAKQVGLPSPSELKAIMATWGAVAHLRARWVHGDLHIGNLFTVGPGQICVIDFGSVTNGPVIADAACLEVSVVFGNPGSPADTRSSRLPDGGSSAARQWLEGVYRYPFDPAAVAYFAEDTKYADAIRAIRGEARKCEADPLPYAIAVACYLLRLASFEDNPTADRDFAYQLAVQIITEVDAEISRRRSVSIDA